MEIFNHIAVLHSIIFLHSMICIHNFIIFHPCLVICNLVLGRVNNFFEFTFWREKGTRNCWGMRAMKFYEHGIDLSVRSRDEVEKLDCV